MAHLRRFFRRLNDFLHPGRAEEELARELATHLSLLEDDFHRRGMTPDEARLAARRASGGIEQTKELHRDARSFLWLEDARRDLKYAIRSLAHNPGFTVVAVLTLALGIGANTAIFSVVNAVLLEPLPYKDFDRLVRITEIIPAQQSFSGRELLVPAPRLDELFDWRTRMTSLSHIAVHSNATMTLSTADGAMRVAGARVSPALFSMLGAHRRVFTSEEERPGMDGVVVIGVGAWQRYFGGDRDIIDQPIVLDGTPYSVIGVMPPGFEFPSRQAEFWIPFVQTAPQAGRATFVATLARLKDGVAIETAAAEANTIGSQLRTSGTSWGSVNFQLDRGDLPVQQRSATSGLRPRRFEINAHAGSDCGTG